MIFFRQWKAHHLSSDSQYAEGTIHSTRLEFLETSEKSSEQDSALRNWKRCTANRVAN